MILMDSNEKQYISLIHTDRIVAGTDQTEQYNDHTEND